MPDLQFDEEGFYFPEASEQDDLRKAKYGTTATTPSFVIRAAEVLDTVRFEFSREVFGEAIRTFG
jgi:hypothetical protein